MRRLVLAGLTAPLACGQGKAPPPVPAAAGNLAARPRHAALSFSFSRAVWGAGEGTGF